CPECLLSTAYCLSSQFQCIEGRDYPYQPNADPLAGSGRNPSPADYESWLTSPLWQIGSHVWYAGRRQNRLAQAAQRDRKSTRLNSSHVKISYAVFCLKKNIKKIFIYMYGQ